MGASTAGSAKKASAPQLGRLRVETLLRLQRTAGNRAVNALLQRDPEDDRRTDRRDQRRRERERTRERGRDRDAKQQRNQGDESPEGRTEGEEERGRETTFDKALRAFTAATKEMDFSHTGMQPRYDAACWNCFVKVGGKRTQYDPKSRTARASLDKLFKGDEDVDFEYELKPGVLPSTAIRRIRTRSSQWALDCIDYVVAARLYAECVANGDDEFDKKYTNLGTKIAPEPMRMAQHDTPGLGSTDLWRRDALGAEFDSNVLGRTGVAPQTPAEEDRFLRKVPIGARVMWSSEDPEGDPDMENENAIKVGPDQYAAHPFGVLSADELRRHLLNGDESDDSDEELDYEEAFDREQQIERDVNRFIYLCEVETYDVVSNAATKGKRRS